MQLHSIEKGASQLLRGRNGIFASLVTEGSEAAIDVLCFEHKEDDGSCKLRIMEIGFKSADGSSSAFKIEPITLTGMSRDDTTVGMAACNKYQILYVFTSKGLIYVIGMESGILLHSHRFESGTIFSCCSRSGEGVLYLCRNDMRVKYVTIDYDILSTVLSDRGLSGVLSSLRNNPNKVKSKPHESADVMSRIQHETSKATTSNMGNDTDAIWDHNAVATAFESQPPFVRDLRRCSFENLTLYVLLM